MEHSIHLGIWLMHSGDSLNSIPANWGWPFKYFAQPSTVIMICQERSGFWVRMISCANGFILCSSIYLKYIKRIDAGTVSYWRWNRCHMSNSIFSTSHAFVDCSSIAPIIATSSILAVPFFCWISRLGNDCLLRRLCVLFCCFICSPIIGIFFISISIPDRFN